MHKNNNKQIIKRISKKSAKANRTRNIFAIMAIVLTTFMISTVFSIGVSFAENYSTMLTRTMHTTASIFLVSPTEEQYETIKELDYPKAVGTQISVGSVSQKTASGGDSDIGILCYDKSEWENHYTPAISDINGTYPEDIEEIMLSVEALEQLGITAPVENMDISLTYITKDGERTDTFRLSGWFTNYKNYGSDGIGIALVSAQFCKAGGFTLEESGMIAISVNTNEQEKVYSGLQEDVALKAGQEFDATFDAGAESATNTISMVLVIGMLALFIVLSGYLLIYNVMYISVSKDIRFYGLLKTIGTSPKQIRKIVGSQMYRLSVIGIPLGLALAAVSSYIITPTAIGMLGTGGGAMPGNVSFHPFIFIGTTLFVLLTIALSCRKPAKIAGEVSPVEAVRYTGVKAKKGKKERTTRGSKLYRLAFHNVFREKKRAFLVFASLFMGTITLLSINGFLGSLDAKNFVEAYYPHDFTYQSTDPEKEEFDKDFMRGLSEIEGVETVETVDMVYCDIVFDEEALSPFLKAQYDRWGSDDGSYEDFVTSLKNADHYGTQLITVSDSAIETYNKTSEEQIDIEAFRNGEIVIVDNFYKDDFSKLFGETLTLVDKISGEQRTVAVGGFDTNSELGIAGLYSFTVGEISGIYVSEAFMESFTDDAQIVFIYIDVDSSKETAVRSELENLNMQNASSGYAFSSKSSEAESFQSSINTMTVMADGISAILILIGILNFINVMLTGVHTRRKELAVMESVGMTKKQIQKMLTCEGIYYAVITTTVIMTLGNIIMYMIARLTPKIADYAVFHYPVVLTAVLIVIIFAVCLAVPGIVYRSTAKESVTERLHDIEN